MSEEKARISVRYRVSTVLGGPEFFIKDMEIGAPMPGVGYVTEAAAKLICSALNTRTQPDNSDVKQEYRNQFDKCRKCGGYIGASEEMLEDSGHACDCAQPDNSELAMMAITQAQFDSLNHDDQMRLRRIDRDLKALQGADNEVRDKPFATCKEHGSLKEHETSWDGKCLRCDAE